MFGNSIQFKALLGSLETAATTQVSILLLGESGTGKELLARHLHQHSQRADQPFVAVNCAALPDALAESALFGHRKGAFTGAVEHHQGFVAAAEGGSLFLDEVAELSLATQARLLRFLESGEYQPVGDSTLHRANVRIIAATHADLSLRVQQGLFRADLYFRLNVVPLTVPPLRERDGDIALLIDRISEQLALQHQRPACRFSRQALRLLETYHWPGNIRELRNFCERMLVLHSGLMILPAHLPVEISQPGDSSSHSFTLPESGIKLDELEKDLLQQALHKTLGNQSKAARLLGLTRDTFLYRLKKYSITGAGLGEAASVTI